MTDTIISEKTTAFFADLTGELEGKTLSKRSLAKLKHTLCQKHGIAKVPTNTEIMSRIPQVHLMTKPMRSQSGVVPIAVMTKPAACPHGRCTFCPGGPKSFFGDVPQSYTGHEPSTMRAIRNNYDPYLIVMNRLEQFTLLGHSPDKVELIIQGGTFPALDKSYQEEVVENCLKAMNDFSDQFFEKETGAFNFEKFKIIFCLPANIHDHSRKETLIQNLLSLKKTSTLDHEQTRNETAHIRCIGLTIETKPDWGKLAHANELLRLGCTRVELGVQTIYDEVLKKTHRGHTMTDTYESIQILKDVGLKINAHLMPGLPDTTYEEDVAGLKAIFDDPRLRPDHLKIYPCQVSEGTALYHQWKTGEFKPLDADTAARMIAAFKETIPPYCRVQRILRDVPTKYWADGVEFTNLRQYIHAKYKPACKCIRCREPKGQKIDYSSVKLTTLTYEASGGTEVFLSFDDTKNDFIIGFCRLRIPSVTTLRPEITEASALIRELHVNGMAVPLGGSGDGSGDVQHKGYGKLLLEHAENIARDIYDRNKIVVISGIGVREYYRKLGYTREGPYMVKMV